MRSIAGWIERHAGFAPGRTALRSGVIELSYAAFAARISGLADWLRSMPGVMPGARVAWLGHNHIDLLALLFACAQERLILVPINWRLSAAEIGAVVDDAGPALLVVDSNCAVLLPANMACPRVTHGFSAPGCVQFPADACAPLRPAPEVSPATPLLLVYTSGTTGTPKGAVLTHGAMQGNALNAVHMHGLGPADRVLTVLPMFHVGGLNIQTVPALYCGAEVIVEPRFEPARTLEMITAWRPTLTTLVPATITALMEQAQWPTTDLSCLRSITTGSTDVPVALIEDVHARGVPVIQIYGATETGPVAIYQRADEAFNTVGAIGRAGLHTDIRLVDNNARDVSDGTPGEILVRGEHVAAGYWDRETARALPFSDGWFHTGDVAVRDSDGVYRFADRLKHVIISGGENIYPAELERVLHGSALVREAAVVGRRDQRWGEVPVVVAVRTHDAVTEAAVLALFADAIARYKRPHAVIFVAALPRTALGKVAIAELKAQVDVATAPTGKNSVR